MGDRSKHNRTSFKQGVKHASTADRIALAVKESKSRRSSMLQSLRIRCLSAQDADEAAQLEKALTQAGTSWPQAATQAVEDALKHQRTPENFSRSLHRLRLLLGNPMTNEEERQGMLRAVLDAGLVQVLAAALKPSLQGAAAATAALKASWITCNMAAEASDVSSKLLALGPLLVAHLGGGFGIDLAMQCAWTIANLAGESEENQVTLVAHGALKPLLALLQGGSRRTADRQTKHTACIATWALCNLVKGASGAAMHTLVALPGFNEAVTEVLACKTCWDLVMEVSWLLSYVAASTKPLIHPILDAGLMTPLLETVELCASCLPATADIFSGLTLAAGRPPADDCAAAMDAQPTSLSRSKSHDSRSATGAPRHASSLTHLPSRDLAVASPRGRGGGGAHATAQPGALGSHGGGSAHEFALAGHAARSVSLRRGVSSFAALGAGAPSAAAAKSSELVQLPTSDEAEQVLIPLLRCVGNLAANATAGQGAQLEGWNGGGALMALIACMGPDSKLLHKEAAWAMSNVASIKLCAEALVKLGAVPTVTRLLVDSSLAVRTEAAYALANLCVGGVGGGEGCVEAVRDSVVRDEDAMCAIVQLLDAPDWAVVYLALQFSEMVCRLLPLDGEGSQLFERCGGVDRLDRLCVSELAPADVTMLAAQMQDRYFASMR